MCSFSLYKPFYNIVPLSFMQILDLKTPGLQTVLLYAINSYQNYFTDLVLILSGLGQQWLEVGLGFPARDKGPGHSSESIKSQPLEQWSVTRALALQLCRKEFPQRWKVVKSVFIRRKKSTVCVDRHRKRLRGRVPETRYPGSLNYLHGAFLLVFL